MKKIIRIDLTGELDRILLFYPFPIRDEEPMYGFQPAIDREYLDEESTEEVRPGFFRKQDASPYQGMQNLFHQDCERSFKTPFGTGI